MSKGSVDIFTMSAYETGIERPAMGTEYTLNGKDNSNFKRYQDAYDDSPTNAFIIKTIVNYVIGDGLTDTSGTLKPHSIISKQDLRLICHDFKLFGSAFPQVLNYEGAPVKIKHTPTMRVGLNIENDSKSTRYLEVNGFWYCWDWKFKFQYAPKFVKEYREDSSEGIQLMHIKTLSSEPFFPFPDWYSGLKSAKIEAALIDDAVNHIMGGFQGKTVININNGGMMTDAEKLEIKGKVKTEYMGTGNADGVIISVNESAEEAITVDTIEPRGRNEQFVTYDETAEIKLMAAHQAMNILFQRPGSSGFSNNAEEIATATDSLYLGVVNPIREIILDALTPVFKKINPSCVLEFVNFKQEKAIVSDAGGGSAQAATEEVDDNGAPVVIDEKTAEAQAQLKGSVGGVSALLEIQSSYAQGLTTYESAISMLDIIFGYSRETAIRLLGEPKTDIPVDNEKLL